ncbi:MAG: metalloregulator ArsR/SmtB family transcription factor [Gemmataceae bacterium]|nr:metalloregulator ArsR/SmtB family transcription factor [Gemmataceae bacterium]
MRRKTRGPRSGKASETVSLLKAVADPDRLKIVESLRHGPKNVTQLAQILRSEIVNVSHHLSVLRRNKIVQFQKRGRFVQYTLNPALHRVSEKGDVLALGSCRLEIHGA